MNGILYGSYPGRTYRNEPAKVGYHPDGVQMGTNYQNGNYVQVRNNPVRQIIGVYLATDTSKSSNLLNAVKTIKRGTTLEGITETQFRRGLFILDTNTADNTNIVIDYITEQKSFPVNVSPRRRLEVSDGDFIFGEFPVTEWGTAAADPMDGTDATVYIQMEPSEREIFRITSFGYKLAGTATDVDIVLFNKADARPQDVVARFVGLSNTDGVGNDGYNILPLDQVVRLEESAKIYMRYIVNTGALEGSVEYITITGTEGR